MKKIPQRIRATIGAENDDFFMDDDIVNYANAALLTIISLAIKQEIGTPKEGGRSMRILDGLRVFDDTLSIGSVTTYKGFYRGSVDYPNNLNQIMYMGILGGAQLKELVDSKRYMFNWGQILPSSNQGFYATRRRKISGNNTIINLSVDIAGVSSNGSYTISDGIISIVVEIINGDSQAVTNNRIINAINNSPYFKYTAVQDGATASQINLTSKDNGYWPITVADTGITGLVVTPTIATEGYTDYSQKYFDIYMNSGDSNQQIELSFIEYPDLITTDSYSLPGVPDALLDAVVYGAALKMSAQETRSNIKDMSELYKTELETNLY